MPNTTKGRRVRSFDEITQPGDYFGPVTGYTGALPAVFFLLPNARDEGASGPQRSIHHVTFPPHTYRECEDGSVEIRASILSRGRDNVEVWHGYLDEGHVWREV
jgi:hypothetical protein